MIVRITASTGSPWLRTGPTCAMASMEDDRIGRSKPRDLIAVRPTQTRSTTWRSSVSPLVEAVVGEESMGPGRDDLVNALRSATGWVSSEIDRTAGWFDVGGSWRWHC